MVSSSSNKQQNGRKFDEFHTCKARPPQKRWSTRSWCCTCVWPGLGGLDTVVRSAHKTRASGMAENVKMFITLPTSRLFTPSKLKKHHGAHHTAKLSFSSHADSNIAYYNRKRFSPRQLDDSRIWSNPNPTIPRRLWTPPSSCGNPDKRTQADTYSFR